MGKPVIEDGNEFNDLQDLGHGEPVTPITPALPIYEEGSKALKVNSLD